MTATPRPTPSPTTPRPIAALAPSPPTTSLRPNAVLVPSPSTTSPRPTSALAPSPSPTSTAASLRPLAAASTTATAVSAPSTAARATRPASRAATATIRCASTTARLPPHGGAAPRAASAGARGCAVVALVAALAACAREPPAPPPYDGAAVVRVGDGPSSLLGVQAHLAPADYATEDRFAAKLRAHLAQARDEGLIDARTVIVLPEYVGTWLVLLDEDGAAFDAPSLGDAMTAVVAKNAPAWAWARAGARVADADAHAVFTAKAERMAGAYERVLGDLARDFNATIVGGSIVLPAPRVVDGRIVVAPGEPLVNAAFVFGDGGALHDGVVVKAFPTATEQGFTVAGDAADLPTFATPAGRLGVLVCADAWFPAAYAAIDDVDAIAVPAFMSGAPGFWRGPWGGYSGHDAPDDVDPDDVGALTEEQAWERYALPGRLSSTSARAGVIADLRGSFWDVHDEGRSYAATKDDVVPGPLDDAALLLSVRY